MGWLASEWSQALVGAGALGLGAAAAIHGPGAVKYALETPDQRRMDELARLHGPDPVTWHPSAIQNEVANRVGDLMSSLPIGNYTPGGQ
jgi:hypothetical protein